MTELTEEQLAVLIAALPPAPQGWVEAALALPLARAAIDELAARATADAAARDAILADLESALRGSGVEPRPHLLESLRTRVAELGE